MDIEMGDAAYVGFDYSFYDYNFPTLYSHPFAGDLGALTEIHFDTQETPSTVQSSFEIPNENVVKTKVANECDMKARMSPPNKIYIAENIQK